MFIEVEQMSPRKRCKNNCHLDQYPLDSCLLSKKLHDLCEIKIELWLVKIVKGDPRNLPLKFAHNQVEKNDIEFLWVVGGWKVLNGVG